MARKINSFAACLSRGKLCAVLHLKTQLCFKVCCISSNDVKKAQCTFWDLSTMPGMSLNISSCSLLVYFRGCLTAGLNQIYICLAEYAWFQGSREVVVVCKVNLSSSQFPFHCVELLWCAEKMLYFFFSSHCGHYVFWAAQCLSGSSFYEQCQGKWSCHWEILWLFLSFFTACFELWPFRTTGKSEVCWMST